MMACSLNKEQRLLYYALTIFLLLLIGGSSTALAGGNQELLERKVTLSVSNMPLEVVLKEIGSMVGVNFVYSVSRVPVSGLVSIDVTDRKLIDVLRELLTPKGIGFTLEGSNDIVLFPENRAKKMDNEQAAVTGKVTDAISGYALPGVSVVIKGTIRGASTDADGKYTLNADPNSVLVFSSIGYKTLEKNIGVQTVADVTLEEDITSFKEVIVNAGYYDVKDKEKTGSIAKVNSDIIEKQPVTNPLGALQGRMPGVYIQQTSGVPGSDFNIQIRGRNSLRADGNAPLYIVDGVPFSTEKVSASDNTVGIIGNGGVSPLTSLNTADIESIEILKDADATAIYGSRGANGVVLITTKKGKAGKTKFDLNVYNGVGKANHLKMLSSEEYLDMRREAFANDGFTDQFPADAYDMNGAWDQSRYTDWQKVLIGGSAHTTSVQGSLSGGSEFTQFLFSTGYRGESSVFPGNLGYQKGSIHLAVNQSSQDRRFQFSASVSGTMDKNDQVNLDFTNEARRLAPVAPPILDDNGNLNWANGTWDNPLSALERTYEGKVNNLIANTTIGYEVVKDLRIKSSFGLNTINSTEFNAYPSTAFNPSSGLTSARSEVRNSTGSNLSWIIEPQITWDKKIAKGKLSLLVGSTFQDQRFEKITTHYQNFPSNQLLHNLPSAAIVNPYDFIKSIYRYTAGFGRVNYNWDGKYIINFTARRDGSSRFGPGKQFSNFGAVGAAWIFSHESFIKDRIAFISFGKLRASFGTTGSDQVGNYQFLDTYSTPDGNNTYQGQTGLVPSRLYNPDFAWETNNKLEGAVELGFLNDRILLNVGYYRNRSSSQLVNYTLPMTTGFTGILANLGATVQNTGVEVELNTTNIKGTITWTTAFNLTVPRNKLISFPNIESSTYVNTYVVGQSIFIQRLYEFNGVDPQTGIYSFRDFNGDGVITEADDRKKSVFVGQNYYGGLNNGFEYRGWKLDIFLQYVKQSGFDGQATLLGGFLNQPAYLLDKSRWLKPGDIVDVQRLATENNQAASNAILQYRLSEGAITDASFIRVKNVSLSYTLPAKWLKGIGARIYFQAQNLFVFTPYEGFDPETQQVRLPPLKMITGGIQLTL